MPVTMLSASTGFRHFFNHLKETIMSNVDIYMILSSKPHNKHYLDRYFKFIQECCQANSFLPTNSYTEEHHICPKAKDLFPEFKDFCLYDWNKIKLTARQHYAAHWMLWKTYGGSQSQAFWMMSNFSRKRKTSRWYQNLTEETNKNRSNLLRGTAVYINTSTNEITRFSTSDERILTGELVSVSKGKPVSEEQKRQISKTLKGRKLTEKEIESRRDHTIYDFTYIKTNERFIGSRHEFNEKFGFYPKHIPYNKNVIEKGWKNTNDIIKRSYKGEILSIKHDESGEIFTGTKKEMYEKFGNSIYHLFGKQKRKSSNGWHVI